MSEKYKDIAELIEYNIKKDAIKLIEDFLKDLNEIFNNNKSANRFIEKWKEKLKNYE